MVSSRNIRDVFTYGYEQLKIPLRSVFKNEITRTILPLKRDLRLVSRSPLIEFKLYSRIQSSRSDAAEAMRDDDATAL